MKKNTIATFVSTLVLTLIIAPAIAVQAATLPFLSGIFDTIQGYISIVNSILDVGKPTTTELENSKKAASDPDTYDSDEIALDAFESIDENTGQINFDESADDASNIKLVKGQKLKSRTIDEFQRTSELTTIKYAALNTAIATKKADEKNKEVVSAAEKTMESAKDILSSQPIGTCDSSLCAENTQNTLVAKQIELQSMAISLGIMSNAYSKISNNQQAILVKSEQDKKSEEVIRARTNSINNGVSAINRNNADRLTDAAY